MDTQGTKPRILKLDLSNERDSCHENEAILKTLRLLREDIHTLILCGYDGINPARTTGETYGVRASEIKDISTGTTSHPLWYASHGIDGETIEIPRLAVYDYELLDDSKYPGTIYSVPTVEALLAIIKLKF